MSKTERAFVIVMLLIVVGAIISICIGKYPITLTEIVKILSFQEVSSMTKTVFWKLRIPRVFMSLFAGAGLGLAGFVYQTLFRNPLASPDIIGISSGANLGAALAISAIGNSIFSTTLGAFAGGLVAVISVSFLVRATKTNTTSTYVLAGIIISSISKALIMMLKYYAPSDSDLAAIEYWTMGSLSSVTQSKVLGILPFFAISFIGLILLKRQIILLSLNEDEARALGVRLKKIRTTILILSTLLVSSVISITGLISFAGLIAPHIAFQILKKNNSEAMFFSSIVGALIVLLSDLCARSLGNAEIPISIITTLIGVPVLVAFMVKRGKETV